MFFLHNLILLGGEDGRKAVRGAAGGKLMDLLSDLLVKVENSFLAGILVSEMHGSSAYIKKLGDPFTWIYSSLPYTHCKELSLTEE